jgi:hypothetical protein
MKENAIQSHRNSRRVVWNNESKRAREREEEIKRLMTRERGRIRREKNKSVIV